MCVGARALRGRSAALSKVIVRTEQNNFAGGGAVAGLVLRAPVEQMLWAPKTHHDILYRMLRTRQKAAPRRSPESWGAQNVPRNRAGKCRNAAGARTVCAAAGARWEDRRQHSQQSRFWTLSQDFFLGYHAASRSPRKRTPAGAGVLQGRSRIFASIRLSSPSQDPRTRNHML